MLLTWPSGRSRASVVVRTIGPPLSALQGCLLRSTLPKNLETLERLGINSSFILIRNLLENK
jgi:hypothetical protein